MATAGVRVLLIGKKWELPGYDVTHIVSAPEYFSIASRVKPDVIVSQDAHLPGLNTAPFAIRRRWITMPETAKAVEVINAIEICYSNWVHGENSSIHPLVSVYTGAYNTDPVWIEEAYESLCNQTWRDWEWVVVDDGSDSAKKYLEIAKLDSRVRPFSMVHSGKIGEVKDTAVRLCRGEFVVELDHDDFLTDTALYELKRAFQMYPKAGMVYANCAEFNPDGSAHKYPGNFWSDRYRPFFYKGKRYEECLTPNVYGPCDGMVCAWFLTVGPNHPRAYRASELHRLGGYNPGLPIADDWDVFARMYLYSEIVQIEKCLYLYRWRSDNNNTTKTRNKSIQDHLKLGRKFYSQAFREKMAKSSSAPIVIPKQYRHSMVSAKEGDVVLDCGAFDGADSLDFLTAVGPSGKVFAFEPSEKVLAKFSAVAGVTLVRMAVSDTDSTVNFSSQGKDYDKVDPAGQETVQSIRLDTWCKNNSHVAPTYIKMDIEGSEMAALRGAAEAIKTYKPKLAISVYHKPEDLTEIPAFIKTLVPEYKTEIVTHTNNDVVLYAWIGQEDKRNLCKGLQVIAIAKNEEVALPGFINQFKNITNRFGIVIDDTTSDNTEKVAEENGAIAYKFKFERFDEQRNRLLTLFSKDAEWFITLDPDERLDEGTIKLIPDLMKASDVDMYFAPLFARNRDGSSTEWPGKPFLVRNIKGLRWIGAVHEHLIAPTDRLVQLRNAKITHDISLHDEKRREDADSFYASLAALPRPDACGFPLLNYGHLTDPQIKQVRAGPLVSVVIPTYKRREMLAKAISSIKRQDYTPIEIIVVGDNCPELAEGPLIIGVDVVENLKDNHKDWGGTARNRGIELARGDWIAYLDDDNEWAPNHVSSLMVAAEWFNAEYAIASLQLPFGVLKCDYPQKGRVDASAIMHKKSLAHRYGKWREGKNAEYANDWRFVEPWVIAKVGWTCSNKATVLYNTETCGQVEFLKSQVAAQEVANAT